MVVLRRGGSTRYLERSAPGVGSTHGPHRCRSRSSCAGSTTCRPAHRLGAAVLGLVLAPRSTTRPTSIAAQLLFAYAFDMLLAWSRRDDYTLGFGPFPVIFSINLFLWFKPDWFYLQFLMVGARLRRQGADPLGTGTAGARTSSIRRRFRWRCSRSALLLTGHERPDVGTGDREHPVLSAAHLPDAVPHRLARAVPLRRDVDDDVGGGHDVPVRARCTSPRPASTFSTIRTSRSRSSSACTCCSPIRRPRPAPSSGGSSSACFTG